MTYNWRFITLLIFILRALSIHIYAQETEIFVFPDSTDILIGDQINLNLIIEKQEGTYVTFPWLTDSLTSGVFIIGDPVNDSTKENNTIRLSRHYMITSFDSGLYSIPSLPFVTFREGQTDTIWSSSSYLMVHSLPADTSLTIYDIKGTYRAPLTFAEIWPWVAGGVLIILLVIAIIYFIRRKKENLPLLKPVRPAEPPHIIAYRELDELKSEKVWQQGKIKEYHSRLTGIIRKYIEGRYQVQAMEQTTTEILSSIKKQINNEKLLNNLEDILNMADLVKFAKGEPLPDDNDRSMRDSYVFIDNTKQISVSVQEDNNKDNNENFHQKEEEK